MVLYHSLYYSFELLIELRLFMLGIHVQIPKLYKYMYIY